MPLYGLIGTHIVRGKWENEEMLISVKSLCKETRCYLKGSSAILKVEIQEEKKTFKDLSVWGEKLSVG